MNPRIASIILTSAMAVLHAGGAKAQAPAAAAPAAETLTVKREAQLRQTPAESAPSLAALPTQTQLTRLTARQGPWIEVRTSQGVTGWVHMFDVGTAPVAQGGNFATGALRGLTSLFGSRGNTLAPTRTATVGIRGLGAEDIANAQPNLAAVTLIDALRLDANQARQFGVMAQLQPQAVEPLPVPARPPQATGTAAGAEQGGSQR